ncbi:glutamate synthase-related protein [Acidipila sp. EB88]|uniref:glutamate synthase-related protein n=1 Tax=Acidipila sp. EB88 TaxID=2305226 RepID=UPI000F5F038B|nr:glutamate synthase-related protein [Acidipila sp. EB88]RRA49744.1 glutamate synthase large subunit [Acidipila sp. EB88]
MGRHQSVASHAAVVPSELDAASSNSLSAGLYDPRFEHESCGVGFVATLTDVASRSILEQALEALSRLAHRGAIASDGVSSDGIGICTAIPRELLLASTGISLAPEQTLAVGMVFWPVGTDADVQAGFEGALSGVLAAQEFEVLGWRTVPTQPSILGTIARSTMPVVRQVLLTTANVEAIERRLYIARKAFERSRTPGYVCSLSSRTIIYKSMCSGRQLPHFYADLADPRYVTSFAIFHQRYATNVAPSWDRAQPLRTISHNGEINTVWGNRARMDARDATLPAEVKPIFSPDGSDSTSLDETAELLSHNGRSIAESIRLMLPPAQHRKQSAFFAYNEDCIEHWDGPAAVVFTDGRLVGAALDRVGLRPCRFFVTDDQLVVVGSEAGLVDLDPEHVVHSGRLGPGQMLCIDLDEHHLYENDEVQEVFDGRAPMYEPLLNDRTLDMATPVTPLPDGELLRLQHGFGYTREDVAMVLKPMSTDGKDAIWSMGDDTPLAPMARSPRPVYAYFRQRFAQVTNPPIDSLREAVVIHLHTRLGPWPHLLDNKARLTGLSLASPLLSLGQVEALRTRRHSLGDELPLAVLDCLLPTGATLASTIEDLMAKAADLVRGGAAILLLSDRATDADHAPVPMALALGAVHHKLIREGIRTQVGLAVEAGDCRDVHHAAVLLGMGAGAVCPWLAFETAKAAVPDVGESNLLKAFNAGLAKIMSKMGISVLDSYRGAHLFDSIGLDHTVIEQCFFGTPAPLGGIGYADLESHVRANWSTYAPAASPAVATAPVVETVNASSEGVPVAVGAGAPVTAAASAAVPSAAAAAPAVVSKDLPDFGWVRFRKTEGAEPHSWQPSTVRLLQTVAGSTARAVVPAPGPGAAWAAFTAQAAEKEPANLRDLLDFRAAGAALPVDSVEKSSSIFARCIASAMSLGSLSPEAHQTVTAAMNLLGGRSNTGEGGEDRSVYQADTELELVGRKYPAHLLNNKTKQIASGRFGVTAEYLRNAEEIEIKMAQGAKPGEGGQLPGHKVTGLIARLRHAQPGVTLISPPPHHDIYSIEDLAQLIYDLKRINPKAAVGVKLVSEYGVGTVAAGVAKAYADYIVIAGYSGGTGASPLSSIKYTGSPWELGLAEAQQTLMRNGLRGRVRLRVDGGLRTGNDLLVAAMLGADEFAFGTAVLVAIGCDMARQCHLNTCPVGIATQREDLRAKFRGKPEHIVRFFEELAGDVQGLLARLGLPSIDAAIGRADLLTQVRHAGGLDLAPMLAASVSGETRWAGGRNDRPETGEDAPIDDAWVEPALAAYAAGKAFEWSGTVSNKDRTLGARLSGELALQQARRQHAGDDTHPALRFDMKGVAGQSFGAFATRGLSLVLEGLANDFVGKGLCGAELVLRGQGRAARESERHVILGNVALYGGTSGSLFAAGRAGERFAVRNSGVLAVVEGVGDHGCEYMTGGTVVVLGRTGMNFGAGMTGGSAWVFDEDGDFLSDGRYHASFLEAERFDHLDEEAQGVIRDLIQLHGEKTGSTRAAWLLAEWPTQATKLVRLTPLPQA